MKKLLYAIWLLPFILQAQHVSKLGRFAIAYGKACAPVTIHVSSQDAFGDIARTYFYEEGLTNTTDTFHTYTTPGTYEIIQFLGLDITPKYDTLTFEVVAAETPNASILTCDQQTFELTFDDSPYDYYQISVNGNAFFDHQPDGNPLILTGSNSGIVTILPFYQDGYPSCGTYNLNYKLENPVAASIVAHEVSPICQGDALFTLEVVGSTNSLYEVILQTDLENRQVFSGALVDNQITFTSSLEGLESYCLQINTVITCNDSRINGELTCHQLTADVLTPLASSYASFSGDAILLSSESAYPVQLFRWLENTQPLLLTTADNPYYDRPAGLVKPYQYTCLVTDTCGLKLDSAIIAPPYLYLKDRFPRENRVVVQSLEPINRLSIGQKQLLIYSADSTSAYLQDFEDQFQLPVGIATNWHVRTIYSTDLGISIVSNAIILPYKPYIFVPQAFTPNGDGLNDNLEVFGLPDPQNFSVRIYNRWGEIIFYAENTLPLWDGLHREHVAAEGTYRYQIDFSTAEGDIQRQVGTFVLLKK